MLSAWARQGEAEDDLISNRADGGVREPGKPGNHALPMTTYLSPQK